MGYRANRLAMGRRLDDETEEIDFGGVQGRARARDVNRGQGSAHGRHSVEEAVPASPGAVGHGERRARQPAGPIQQCNEAGQTQASRRKRSSEYVAFVAAKSFGTGAHRRADRLKGNGGNSNGTCMCAHVCVRVCACLRKRKSERGRDRQRKTERKRDSETQRRRDRDT